MAVDSIAADDASGECEVTDRVIERLTRSLEMMEADYQATLDAERRMQATPTPPLASMEASADLEDDEESSGMGGGYAALGSDDGGSEPDCPGDEDACWGGFQCGSLEQADDGVAFAPPSRAAPTQAGEEADWPWGEKSQDDLAFESFADFGSSNSSLPGPPSHVPPLLAKPLTADEVNLIKDTMRDVCPAPPAWATQLSDSKIKSMVQELLRNS
eukprot:TRINITY_DN5236_c0_g1_i1.p1 TRINITY_DN5236_c0_g1~~TRINITY_DN5236_c0_g1_i1.p1  ORF type:complete len:226 (-),score=59.04 TRINITY_DN5236_c0_g1_i1:63-707(-)